jgi:hypothetical protein
MLMADDTPAPGTRHQHRNPAPEPGTGNLLDGRRGISTRLDIG